VLDHREPSSGRPEVHRVTLGIRSERKDAARDCEVHRGLAFDAVDTGFGGDPKRAPPVLSDRPDGLARSIRTQRSKAPIAEHADAAALRAGKDLAVPVDEHRAHVLVLEPFAPAERRERAVAEPMKA